MNKYEAMVIIRPELSEEDRKNVLAQITDTISANKGAVVQSAVWSERKKLHFPIKKHNEGVYYLINFTAEPGSIVKLEQAYKLNDNVLRCLITTQIGK